MFKFTKSIAFPNVHAGTYHVDWEGAGNEDVVFKVYYSREDEGPWILVNTYDAPAVDITLDILNLNFVDPIYFIIKAHGKISGTLLDTSEITQNSYIPERGHYLRYKEIIRRSYLDITRYVGARTAYLFRLKTYGATASNVNPILGMPIGLEDESSFGQKFEGGYFDPILIPCGYVYGDDANAKMTTQEQGATDVRKVAIKVMPSPVIRPYDIIVNPDSNSRYVVVAPVDTNLFRGLTITQLASMNLLPLSDKAYNLELP